MKDYDERLELSPDERLAPEQETELAEALRAAFAPAPLSPARHAEILALALEDPLAPPSADELRESERLRRALDEGDESHPDAALARALRSALNPEAMPRAAERQAREGVLGAPPKPSSRGNVVYASFGVLTLAAAAGFALLFALPQSKPAPSAAARPALAQSRTTGPLFPEPFEPGEATARIDRIALSRGRDLRENRYALWGVR